jgi:hypothetical protein
MRSTFLILIFLSSFIRTLAQSEAGFEQYTYIGGAQGNTIAPLIHYQTKNKWYTEARYNYEDLQTFSLYAGRTFSSARAFEYSFTPMVGAMAGKLQGGLLGLNMNLGYKNFYFSSQSQYAVSATGRNDNFFFSWSEFGYQPLTWIYGGVSLQHTQLYNTASTMEPGILLGVSIKQWTIPVYGFNIFHGEQYFVVGINWQWKKPAPSATQPPALSYTTGGLQQD